MKKINQKVVVVTGGAGILGKEFISALAKNNFIAICADVDSKKNLLKKKINTDFVTIDITSELYVKNAIQHIHKKYGRIDALVNNAYPRNKNYGRKFENVSYNDFCENVNMHLGGYFLTSKLFAKYFKKQGYGNIINIASIYGVMAPRFEIYERTNMTMPVEYAVIKSAIIHLTKYMAKYFRGKNIRVNCISPGGIFNKQPKSFVKKYSELSLKNRMLTASDITGTLLFLLSDDSASINGQNIIVDEGWTL
jgi:NAD(P)-dependent dehydrogenase (short-subunit alcohol dehydrogenase family)